MEPDTPGDEDRGRGPRPPRRTDYARLLLRRAQLALCVLAMPVAVNVGVVVAGTAPDPVLGSASTIEAGVPAGAISELARAEELVDDPRPKAVPAGTVNGIMAGLSTLSCCWILLATAGTIWRRRLAERDLRDWADGWASVEPLWSGRPV